MYDNATAPQRHPHPSALVPTVAGRVVEGWPVEPRVGLDVPLLEIHGDRRVRRRDDRDELAATLNPDAPA